MLQIKRDEIANASQEEIKYADSVFKPSIYHLLDNENKTLSLEDVKDELSVILITGFETSANMILFILILVGSNPRVQRKIFAELEEVFGDSDRDVTKADLSKLIYIDAVLKETSRYWPVKTASYKRDTIVF
ncbi:unnamed protein product [Leptidea sinapis]|nr:unnamed protein product [Leptidea sinapis]